MFNFSRRNRALIYGVSAIAVSLACVSQSIAQSTQTLDTITVVATKTQERAIDSLAPVSVLDQKSIQIIDPSRINQLLYNIPGVNFQDRGDSPETSINIRGLQDFGRVAVIVDGARQNYQRTGHNSNGSFYLDPELLAGLDIVRGPTANIYGSGAIGGVASFRTKDVDDILKPGEKSGTNAAIGLGSNTARLMSSGFSAWRINPNVEAMAGGVYRTQDDYYTGNVGVTGVTVPSAAVGLVQNSGSQVSSGIAKVTLRPQDGHQIKFGGIFQNDLYDIGQPPKGTGTANSGTSTYATDVKNYQTNVRWLYSKPEDRMFDWDANVYWNRTENDQTKIRHSTNTSQGNQITGFVGRKRGYTIDTIGTDIHNTSRVDFDAWRTALTIGVDGFQDSVSTFDETGNSNVTTPGGRRMVSGAFAQIKANYQTWLEMIGALRFDNYALESGTITSSANRFSPKITVGVTPVAGFQPYASYAEGYRSPSITETLVTGAHVSTGAGQGLFSCPDGGTVPPDNFFCFQPNPNLRPEVGKTKEVGVNLKYDNIFAANDSFRGKLNVYRNDLEDYIDLVNYGPSTVFGGQTFYAFYQNQNIPTAHIQGFEAETMYDAGAWFLGVSGTIMRGYNDQTGIGLATIPGDKVTTTAVVRSSDRKVTIGATVIAADANLNVPTNYKPSTSYELVNVFYSYQPVEDVVLALGVDNLFNRYYRPFAVPTSDIAGTQNDVFWTSPPPGLVVKGSLRVHFAGMK